MVARSENELSAQKRGREEEEDFSALLTAGKSGTWGRGVILKNERQLFWLARAHHGEGIVKVPQGWSLGNRMFEPGCKFFPPNGPWGRTFVSETR